MHSLRSISNGALLDSAHRLASEERRITLSVLEHFREIERRKAYSDLGYKSLFEYAVTHLKYSEGSASRRINAMYALKEAPELAQRISSGETSVTAVAKIHSTVRRDEKLSGEKWTLEEKKNLFQEMASLPMREIERGLASIVPEAALSERVRAVTPDLHEVRVFLTTEELKALEELRAAFSNSMKDDGSNTELVRKLIGIAQEQIARRRASPSRSLQEEKTTSSQRKASPLRSSEEPQAAVSQRRTSRPRSSQEPQPAASQRRASPPRSSFRRPHLPTAQKKKAFQRANFRCEESLPDGKRCNSLRTLQCEHVVPIARGGTHDLSNLQVLCRAHNLIRGIRVFGEERMRRG